MSNRDPKLGHLFSLPVNDPERNQLRDRIRTPNDKLAARARKFLTLGEVYAQRDTYAKQQAEGLKWQKWLASFMSPADVKATLQAHKEGKL